MASTVTDFTDAVQEQVTSGIKQAQEINIAAIEVARDFAAAGTRWLHVVDLDAARTGEPANLTIIETICASAFSAMVSGSASTAMSRRPAGTRFMYRSWSTAYSAM